MSHHKGTPYHGARRRGLAISALLAGAIILSVGPAAAEEDEIATDRPDFVESAKVVGKGRLQLETSVASERDKAAGVKTTLTSTPTLLRFGVADSLELRVETDGALVQRENGVRTRGTADGSVGVKWQLAEADEKSGKPGLALLAHLDLASGSRAFRGEGTRPSLRAVAEWELADEIGIGIMPGVFRETGPAGKFTGWILAATVSKGWTSQFRTFAEIAGRQLTSSGNGGNIATFDVGAAFLMNKNLQWDIAFTRGLNQRSPDVGVTIGVSIRY